MSHTLVFFTEFPASRFDPGTTDILLIGDADISDGAIELTRPGYTCRVGQVIYNGKVPLWESTTGKAADFITHFSFIIDKQNSVVWGHGLAFFLAPIGFQTPLNSLGGYLGMFNTTTTDSTRTQIVSVEFDTFANGWDPSYEHVGINNNSITSLVTAPWNFTQRSGETVDAWIAYNATSWNLTVSWSYRDGSTSSLAYSLDLKGVLPQWVVIGISATTGSNMERHILRSWDFTSSHVEIKERDGNLAKKVGLIAGLTLSGCVLIALVLIGFVVWRRRRQADSVGRDETEVANLTSMDNDLERGAGPRRFSYKELASATNNFSDERKLGEGGFGGVYKGYLMEQDMLIAVKKFSRKSKQGKKEYITEVKIISMLRHRNLVHLIGWCHDQSEFLLVYEFMPKGSLDHHLFGKKPTIAWSLRYKIAQGLASALLYLHEEWEQCVVHRDIKSSNVMLDLSFNAKLGDFGLARLMDHGLDPQTTGLAGTLGYMAPEYLSTWRASKESDIYSFGVVLLEIATGKKAIDTSDDRSEKGFVEWVWDFYGNGDLLSVVDGRLQMDFEAKQVERVMIVGLWCAHPNKCVRPSIRQASHVLNFEAELPNLPSKMPVATYRLPITPSVSSCNASITSSSINVGR